jgi:fumarylacetoacetate (FAA) hydrolase
MAPFAVTPDELGANWRNFRPALHLRVHWNGAQFGDAFGEPMAYGFNELVAHAARTRNLVAGTVIGSGTVSNRDAAGGPGRPVADGGLGYSCIAEVRMVETILRGEPETPFLKVGDRVAITMRDDKHHPIFGVIEQVVGG